jgi:hypothetical protein
MFNTNENEGLQTLLNRVDTLETENRRMKRTGKLILGASVLFGLLGAATPMFCKTVWAERLVLRNSSGRDVMTMDAYSGDQPTVTMRDDNGKSVVRLSWEEGLKMAFLNDKGLTSTSVKVTSDGKTEVTQRDSEGQEVSMRD